MFARVRKTGFGLLALSGAFIAIVCCVAAVASASAAFPDIRGEWEGHACPSQTVAECETHLEFPQKFVIETEDFSTGAITGKGPTYTITGTVSGNVVTTHTHEGGSETESPQTINAEVNKLSGIYSANGNPIGATYSTRISPSPTEEAAKKAKEETEAKEKNAKHATATMVTCNYEFATSENTCVAEVGDAGAVTPVMPTGTVTFTTTSGGFTSPASCSLSPTSGSPSVGSCTLVYETANSGLPEITATYGGDARHTGSVGHTQFLGAGSEEGTAETPPGKAGEYPNEIDLGLNVPTNGTTVEGVAQGANPDPAPLPLTLPALTGLDATSAADLQLVETDLTKVNNTGAQNAADVKALDQSMDDLNQQAVAAKNAASTPAAQAEAQKLMQDAQKVEEELAKIVQQKTELMKAIAKNIGSVFIATRHKTAKRQKTRAVKPLGYVVKDNAPAGKLKLVLKLNRAALNKLADKRNSVTVYVRVNMILPSALYKSGLPRSFVERLTLKRTAAGKGRKKH